MPKSRINAGRLRHRVNIVSDNETRSPDTGEVLQATDSTLGSRWAAIDQLSGREYEYASQKHSEVTHKITIRFLEGVTAKHRVEFGSRIFEILAPPENIEELGHTLIIMAKEQI